MRKRPARIEGQRGEHGKGRVAKISVGDGQLLLVQRGVIQDLNAGFRQRRQQLFVQAFVRLAQQLLDFAADGYQLRGRMHAVRADIQNASVHLVDQSGDAHHEEFIHVGAHDGKEFHAFEQRIVLVSALPPRRGTGRPAG